MKVTINDVAKKAEVSVATVSRVLNNNYPVNVVTRARVNKVIKDMQFIPNMQAQEIKHRKSRTIGIIVPSVDNMFFPEVINGVEDYLMKHDYSLLLCFSKNSKEREKDNVRNLLSRNVAGIIIADADLTNVENHFYDEFVKNTPITFINGNPSHDQFSHVLCDEEEGANQALQALWNHGHRHIYFIRGINSHSYDVKENAYRTFMKQHNEECDGDVIYVGEGNSSKVIDVTRSIMVTRLLKDKNTAAFCCNDLMALGVIDACKELAMDIPKDFSIIGFDNIILSKFVQPKLTTVDQNMVQLGLNAASLMVENIEAGKKLNKTIVLSPKLVMRETLGKNSNK
ncbi:MAG: LacI family DNA-binding transcriptional regulator [Erysipelotrichaceae bacterium]